MENRLEKKIKVTLLVLINLTIYFLFFLTLFKIRSELDKSTQIRYQQINQLESPESE